MYLKNNRGKTKYIIKSYDKLNNVLKVTDPDTGANFDIKNVKETLKRTGFSIKK